MKNERGSIHMVCGLALFCISIGAFGTWGVLRHWRHLTEIQIRLDECVGRKAIEIKTTLNRIESINSKMSGVRAAILVTTLPPAQAALRAALEVLGRLEDLELLNWHAKQAFWLVKQGCGKGGDIPSPLPSLPYQRVLPDSLGSKPLKRQSNSEIKVVVFHPPRAAAAVIKTKDQSGGEIEHIFSQASWSASWSSPKSPTTHPQFGWASFD